MIVFDRVSCRPKRRPVAVPLSRGNHETTASSDSRSASDVPRACAGRSLARRRVGSTYPLTAWRSRPARAASSAKGPRETVDRERCESGDGEARPEGGGGGCEPRGSKSRRASGVEPGGGAAFGDSARGRLRRDMPGAGANARSVPARPAACHRDGLWMPSRPPASPIR